MKTKKRSIKENLLKHDVPHLGSCYVEVEGARKESLLGSRIAICNASYPASLSHFLSLTIK